MSQIHSEFLLRSSIFTFLWGNSEGHHQLYFASWRSVSVPYEFGGWDIKNLEWFGISLRLKSLWQILMGMVFGAVSLLSNT